MIKCCCLWQTTSDKKYFMSANGRMERKVSTKSNAGYAVKTRKYVYLPLTLKAPSKICSRRHSIFFSEKTSLDISCGSSIKQTGLFSYHFSEKASLDISCESSAWQTIYMKFQNLFSLKNEKKKSSAAVVISVLRVNPVIL